MAPPIVFDFSRQHMEKNLNESFISTQEREGGDFEYTAEQLAEVCILDNHYKMPSNPNIVISSNMIVNDFKGIDNIMKKLGTKPKTGISPDDVERRKKAFGPNYFPPPHIKSLCELIMENFEDKIN